MVKNIELTREDGTTESVAFKATGTTPIRYKQAFGRELLGDITAIISSAGTDQLAKLLATVQAAEAAGATDVSMEELVGKDPEALKALIAIVGSGKLESLSQMAYIMHEQAAGADMSAVSLSGYIDWLDQYDTMSFLTHAMDFISLYLGNKETSSTAKKDPALPTAK